jgi:hypothetical protein
MSRLTRRTFGIPGALGALILLVWAIGWIGLGWHDGPYHALVPIGIVLVLIQFGRRVATG